MLRDTKHEPVFSLSFALAIIALLTFSTLAPIEAAAETNKRTLSALDLASISDIGSGVGSANLAVSPNKRYVAFHVDSPAPKIGAYDRRWYVIDLSNGRIKFTSERSEVTLYAMSDNRLQGHRRSEKAIWISNTEFIARARYETMVNLYLFDIQSSEKIKITDGSFEPLDAFLSVDMSAVLILTDKDERMDNLALNEEETRGFFFDSRFGLPNAVPNLRGCEDIWSAPKIRSECNSTVMVFDLNSRSLSRASLSEAAEYDSLSQPTTRNDFTDKRVTRIATGTGDVSVAWLERAREPQFRADRPSVSVAAVLDSKTVYCPHSECMGTYIRGLWINEGSNEVIFSKFDGQSYSETSIYVWNPNAQSIRKIAHTKGRFHSCEIGENQLICVHEEWTQPGKLIAIDLFSGAKAELYNPNPVNSSFEYTRIEQLTWVDSKGATSFGQVVFPKNYSTQHSYPAVIVTYRSRGFLRGGVGDEYPIHVLAAAGFVVLSFDAPRGFDRNASLESRNRTLESKMTLLELASEIVNIDREKVAITGFSDGVVQALHALRFTSIFETAILSSFGYNPTGYFVLDETNRRYWTTRYGVPYSDEEESTLWERSSIGLNVPDKKKPLLVNVSDEELLLGIEDYVRMKQNNYPVEMYVYNDGYHMKWRSDHRLAIYRRNVQWLLYWLQDKRVDDPVDPQQYKRWDFLREQRDASVFD